MLLRSDVDYETSWFNEISWRTADEKPRLFTYFIGISVAAIAVSHSNQLNHGKESNMSTAPSASLPRASQVGAAQAAACEQTAVDPGATEEGLSAFLSVRPRLFGIAYRMLGSAAEAEDIVQDVWIRWQTTDRSVVRDAPAFLATTTTRLAINVIQSARARREICVGCWLPEPVDTSADPRAGAERSEALERAVLMLLERLSSTERAAYVLREAFDYPYREIAGMLRLEEANTRQLVTRARRHVADGRRLPVTRRRASCMSHRPAVPSLGERECPALRAPLLTREPLEAFRMIVEGEVTASRR